MKSIGETPSGETVYRGAAIRALVKKHTELCILAVIAILGLSGHKLYEKKQIQRELISDISLQIAFDRQNYASTYGLPLSEINDKVSQLLGNGFSPEEILEKLRDDPKSGR